MDRTPEPSADAPIRRGIQTRIAVLVLVAALAPVVLLGSASLASLRVMREALLRERTALVDSACQQADRALRAMLEALAAVPGGPDDSARARRAQEDALRAAHLSSRLLSDALVVDSDGRSSAGSPHAVAASPLFREAMRIGAPVVCRDPGDASRRYAIVPLRAPNGRTIAAAVGVLDCGSVAWAGLTPHAALGGSARWRIVDERGDIVAGDAAKKSGDAEVVVDRPLAVLPWRIVLSEPDGEVFAPVRRLQRRLFVLTPSLVAFAGVFAWGIARSVKRPLALLEGAAARIAAGDLLHPVPSLGEDEIGRLGSSFEAMRRALARDETRRKLLRKVISAQEEERKRLARELHDETCQTITALKMKLDATGAPEARALADRTLDELHRIIYDLRPSILDDLGLLAAIRWAAERNLRARGIQVRVESDDLPERLPPEIEIAVFRAVQEAVSNVVRHANADAALIEIAISKDDLTVSVEDDGDGFDPAEVSDPKESGRGLGILGMRERMELVGGSANVTSSPGAGTRVVLRVPIPAPREA